MRIKNFSFRIASDTNNEKVFAEVFYDEEQWAEISQEGKELVVIFLSPFSSKYWKFPLEEALETLHQVKRSLLEE